jgi:glycosyltransferase involved in cell wall biosynthesis
MPTALVAHPSADLYGASRVMLETVSALTDRGWRVVVALPEDGPLLAASFQRGAKAYVVRAPVVRRSHLGPAGLIRLAASLLGGIRPGLRLLRAVRPDTVYVSTTVIPLWVLLARLARRPVVCHVHEAEASAPHAVRLAMFAPLLLASSVVVNSRFSLGVITRTLPRLAARSQVLYNGVPGPPAPVPPRLRLDGGMRLLYLGRLSERKGVPIAVDAVGRLADRGFEATLDLAGSAFAGHGDVEAELRARARRAGVADRVRFLGFVPEVWPLLAAADVLVVPSAIDEPFGNTAVEGALAARPVVATRTSGLLEATDGLPAVRTAPPGDPDALADAIEAVAVEWSEVRARAVDGAAAVATRYAPERYRDAIARHVATAR